MSANLFSQDNKAEHRETKEKTSDDDEAEFLCIACWAACECVYV